MLLPRFISRISLASLFSCWFLEINSFTLLAISLHQKLCKTILKLKILYGRCEKTIFVGPQVLKFEFVTYLNKHVCRDPAAELFLDCAMLLIPKSLNLTSSP